MNVKTEQQIETEVGQVYESERSGEFFQAIYVDEEIVLLRCSNAGRNGQNTHRIERRGAFEQKVSTGWFEYKPESELDMLESEEQDWSVVENVGETAAQNLRDEGFETTLDIQQASADELMEIPWVGELGANNLKQFAR